MTGKPIREVLAEIAALERDSTLPPVVEACEPRRYIVKIVDTEGVLWLNSGSFPLSTHRHLLAFVEDAVRLAKDTQQMLYADGQDEAHDDEEIRDVARMVTSRPGEPTELPRPAEEMIPALREERRPTDVD